MTFPLRPRRGFGILCPLYPFGTVAGSVRRSRDEDDFNDAWERLVKTVPQYEKLRKSVKTNK